MEGKRAQVALALGILYVVWGSTYLAIRIAVETVPPFLMAGVRFLIAGGILYAWTRWRGAERPKRIHWKSTTIVGAFLLVGGNGGVCWAERIVPSGLTVLLLATIPLWMVVLDWLCFGAARPSRRVTRGLALGFAGAAILVAPGTIADGTRIEPIGAVVLTGCTIFWAIGSLYARRAVLPSSVLLTTAMEMIMGGLLLVGLSASVGEWRGADHWQISARSMWAVAYLIVFGALLGFSAYAWLLRSTSTAVASTYAYVNPLIAVALGALVLGESFSSRTLVAGAAILAAVVMIISQPSASVPKSEPSPEPA